MKSLSLLLISLLLPPSSIAQDKGITFDEREIPELISIAKTSGKLIFIDVTAKWCKPCKEMELTTFLAPEVSEFYNKNFISKKFDLDGQYNDNISINIKKETTGVPKFYFLDADGSTILIDAGLKKIDALIALGEKALKNKNVHAELNHMNKEYTSHLNDTSFLLKYMQLREETGLRNGAILNDYMKLVSPEDYLKESTINIIIKNESNLNGTGYQIISDRENQIKAFNQNNGSSELDYRMYVAALYIIENNMTLAVKTKDKDLLDKAIEENLKVRQNKQEANEINKKALDYFSKLP